MRVFGLLIGAAIAVAGAADAGAQESDLARRAVAEHIRPGYAAFAAAAETLIAPAEACDADRLRAAFHAGFDAWLRIEHIAFGPVEQGDRRFAILFWPDPKGHTPRGLKRLEENADPVVDDPDAFAKRSIAVRGFGALERLLFEADEPRDFAGDGGDYRCRLALAIARDLSRTASAVAAEWNAPEGIARALTRPGSDPAFQSDADVRRALFKSLDGGLEKISAMRLGRPLGTFERPRPRRAETWRSGRSMRNVREALAGLERYYAVAFARTLDEAAAARLTAAFARTRAVAERTPDDMRALSRDPQARFRVEALQSRVRELQRLVRKQVAPALGVAAGFNALDGD
ncbi:MAG: imelysin family protein [Pseudomonadota bacterium]